MNHRLDHRTWRRLRLAEAAAVGGAVLTLAAATLWAFPAWGAQHAWISEDGSAGAFPPGAAPQSARPGLSAARSGALPTSLSWSSNPSLNLLVNNAPGAQVFSTAISDGAGGMIVVWEDARNSADDQDDIYAQHVLKCGLLDPTWPSGGVALTTAAQDDVFPVMVSDGSGGALVAWSRTTLDGGDIFAQHLLSSGVVDPSWPANGLGVCTASGTQDVPKITSDGAHGAYVTWDDGRPGAPVVVQHVLSSGVDPAWTPNGTRACPASAFPQIFPTLCSDGAGGLIVAWTDNRDRLTLGRRDIYAQRMSPTGSLLWASSGVPACTAPGLIRNLNGAIGAGVWITNSADGQGNAIVPDGAGGCLLSFTDNRDAATDLEDVYAQHLTSTGAVAAGWDPNGVALCKAPDQQTGPTMVPDGAGGAIASWFDLRPGVYAQHVTAAGLLDGPADGLRISSSGGVTANFAPDMVSDGSGGAVLAWADERNAIDSDLFALRVRSSPSLAVDPGWTPDGTPVSVASGDQFFNGGGGGVSDGAGGMIMSWDDLRGADDDVYAQAVRVTGALAPVPPAIGAPGAGVTIECPATPAFTPPTAQDEFGQNAVVNMVGDVTTPGSCAGSYTEVRSWQAVDGCGNLSAQVSQTITVADTRPPVTSAPGADATITFPATPVFTPPTASDVCDPNAAVYLVSDVTTPGSCAGAYSEKRTWNAVDACGNVSSPVSQTITVQNSTPPVATITGPVSGAVFPINTAVNFTGSFTDNAGDTHTAQWTFDALAPVAGVVDESNQTVSASYTFTTAGVYSVGLKVIDQCGNAGTGTQVGGLDALVVIYDPSGGFVTGGGWINSPPGAYAANPGLTGKANFGFVSKYQKGRTIPDGETEFEFKTANLDFHSALYDWLVISGARAQYQGSGTLNASGDYLFMLTAIDGQISGGGGSDKFRIKIIDKATSAVIYDNQMGAPDSGSPTTEIGGGSIVIHSASGFNGPTPAPGDVVLAGIPVTYALFPNRPNPFSLASEIQFALPERSRVKIDLYDLAGRRVANLVDGDIEAGIHSTALTRQDAGGSSLQGGVYFVRMTANSLAGGAHFTSTRKVLMIR